MNPARRDDVAFLRSCVADPADDLPRLVWADHLDETGRPAAAAYMRGDRGAVLIGAAHEQLRSGADPAATTALVVWLADGGMGVIASATATAVESLGRFGRAAGQAFAGLARTFQRLGLWTATTDTRE